MIGKLKELKKISDPTWRRRRIQTRINRPIQRKLFEPTRLAPESDWDTLVILDACPADLFESVVGTTQWDTYETARSGAGNTYQWLKEHWKDDYADTVYVSGNPMVSRHVPGQFHDLIEPWRDAITDGDSTPSAEPVTKTALDVHREYPHKRVVVHYMQPHYPFIRDTDLQFTNFEATDEWQVEGDPRASDVWEALRKGIVSEPRVRDGYRRNLEYVIEEVETLLSGIDGKVVVGSDHGNLFGTYTFPIPIKEYGHSCGLPQPSLSTVPWATREGDRREIIAEDIRSESGAQSREIESHLEALGYA